LAGHGAQYRIDQAGRASFPGLPCELDRLVYGRPRRHALEVEQLIGAQPQDVQYLRIELCRRALRRAREEIIELT
jgi:hypothetical protein